MKFSGVRVFSATMREERERLGERVTAWLEDQGNAIDLVDYEIRQSSDDRFHLVSIVIFYNEAGKDGGQSIDHAIKGPARSAVGESTRRLSFKATR